MLPVVGIDKIDLFYYYPGIKVPIFHIESV